MTTSQTEIWKPIPGFPAYDVSNHGRVRSYYTRGVCPEITSSPLRILKNCKLNNGHYIIKLYKDGNIHRYLVHRLVMLAFVGPCPDGLEVCHNDGDPTNNHLDNLRYDTHSNNISEAVWHGNRRFTPLDIVEARKERRAGATVTSLAKKYNVAFSTMSALCNGRTYKIIGGPLTRGKSGRPRKQPAPAPASGNGGKE